MKAIGRFLVCATLLITAGVMALSVAGCPAPGEPGNNEVFMRNVAFDPAELTIAVGESVTSVGRELKGPVRDVFAEVTERLSLGDPVEIAVAQVADDVDTPEIKFFGISLSIQRETGGNLAETLANLSDILRRRRQMKLKIKAISSEARASAYILCALPFVMFVLLYFTNNDYIMQLFNDPRGLVMIGGGMGMMCCGAFVMFRMVSFEI